MRRFAQRGVVTLLFIHLLYLNIDIQKELKGPMKEWKGPRFLLVNTCLMFVSSQPDLFYAKAFYV
jgi:hypothetical protein